MNEKLKESIEHLAEERNAIQSKIDDVKSELNRLFPLKNDLVDILSKKHECLKGLKLMRLRWQNLTAYLIRTASAWEEPTSQMSMGSRTYSAWSQRTQSR